MKFRIFVPFLLLLLALSLYVIAFIKSTYGYHNVQYVVHDTYRSVEHGTSIVHTEYCKVKDPTYCFNERSTRVDPKFKVGQHVQQYQQEFDPITNFILVSAVAVALFTGTILVLCFVIWITPTSTCDISALNPKKLR